MSLKKDDKVKVKLRQPIGNPTTESVNQYLRTYEGRIGTVDKITKVRSYTWVTVWFPHEANHHINSGVFEPFELEKVDETSN